MYQFLWTLCTIILSIGVNVAVAARAGSVSNIESSRFWWDILEANDGLMRFSDLVDMSLQQTLSLPSSDSTFWKRNSTTTETASVLPNGPPCSQFGSPLPDQHRDEIMSLGQMMAKYWVTEQHSSQMVAKASRRLGRSEQLGSIDDSIQVASLLPESLVICSNAIGPRLTSNLSLEEDGYQCFLDMIEGIIYSLDTKQNQAEMATSLLGSTIVDHASDTFILATPLVGNVTSAMPSFREIWLMTYDGLLTTLSQEAGTGVVNESWYFISFQLTELVHSQGNPLLPTMANQRPHRQQQQAEQPKRLQQKSSDMDDVGMDMGNDFCNGMSMIMAMKGFQFSVLSRKKADCITYFVAPWKLSDSGKFVGAMIYSFLLAIMTEALTSAQQRIKRHLSPGKTRKWVMSVLYGIQQFLGYVVMFIAMTYSIELFLAVIVGLMIGNAFYPHSKRPGDDDDDEINDINRPMTPQLRRMQAAARQRQIEATGSNCGCDDLQAFWQHSGRLSTRVLLCWTVLQQLLLKPMHQLFVGADSRKMGNIINGNSLNEQSPGQCYCPQVHISA